VDEYILKEMNSRSSIFDVGSISSINPTGNRDVIHVLKGEDNNREYKTNSDRINSYVVAVTNNQIYFLNNEIQKLNKNKSNCLLMFK